MDEIGFSSSAADERGFVYPAVHIEADYVETISVDDTVTVELVPSIGDTSITLTASGTLDGETVFTAELTLACVDSEIMEPTAIPTDVRERLAAYGE